MSFSAITHKKNSGRSIAHVPTQLASFRCIPGKSFRWKTGCVMTNAVDFFCLCGSILFATVQTYSTNRVNPVVCPQSNLVTYRTSRYIISGKTRLQCIWVIQDNKYINDLNQINIFQVFYCYIINKSITEQISFFAYQKPHPFIICCFINKKVIKQQGDILQIVYLLGCSQ